MRGLNSTGYGMKNSGLRIDIVHNPVGAYLSGSQAALEHEYHERLLTEHGIHFNQMLDLTVNHGAPKNIMSFDMDKLKNREIVTSNHCYGCVAGCGSSCQGATTAGD